MSYKNPKDPRLLASRRKHYYNNKEQYIKNKRKRIRRIDAWLRNYKKTLKCQECGENHPACLDFHHRNEKDKIDAISKVIHCKGWGKELILEETSKCDILCANCHRKLHYNKGKSVNG